MKTKKNRAALFLLALGFFVAAHAQAQVDLGKAAIDALNAEAQKKGLERASQPTQNVAQPQVLATVSIQNAKLEKQTAQELIMTFDLNNRDLVQPNVKYAVRIVDVVDGKSTVIDFKTYDESITIAANKTISKKISYLIPSFIKGEYEVYIEASTEQGMPLGVAFVGKLTFEGSGGIIAISKDDCSLVSVTGGKETSFSLDKGAIIDPKSGASLVCKIKNATKSQVVVFPQATLNEVGPFGKQIEQKKIEKVSVEVGAEAKISYQIPTELASQLYQIRLDILDNKGEKISQPIFANFGTNSLGVLIQNILLDKESYSKGDVAKVVASIGLYGQSIEKEAAPVKLNVAAAILDGKGSVCGSLSKATNSDDAQKMELSVPINTDCAQPSVTIKVTDEKGNELGSEKFGVEGLSKEASQENGMADGKEGGMISNSALVIIIITIIALSVILIFMLGKKSRKTKIGIFMILFAGGLIFTDLQASADTINLPGFPVVSTTYSLDKSVYSPGEQIVVNAQASAWTWPFMCNATWYGIVAALPTGNGTVADTRFLIFWPFGMCSGARLNAVPQNYTAPTTVGNYNAYFGFCYYNFCFIQTIPFRVVATDGACGSANGLTLDTKPTLEEQLCSAGKSTPVIGDGPWSWKCSRVTPTGKDANCSALKSPTHCSDTVSYGCVKDPSYDEKKIEELCEKNAGKNIDIQRKCMKTITKCDGTSSTSDEPDKSKCNGGSGCPPSTVHCPKGSNTNAGGYREVTP